MNVSFPAAPSATTPSTPTAEAIDAGLATLSETAQSLSASQLAKYRYLAKRIDECAREYRGARVVSLFEPAPAGHSGIPAPAAAQASMHAIIAKQYCLFGCGLVYVGLIPGTVGGSTLEALLDSLVSWLRPRGELILCVSTALTAAPLLQALAGGCAAGTIPERLLQLARNIDDATPYVHCEPADNLAFLHLQRH